MNTPKSLPSAAAASRWNAAHHASVVDPESYWLQQAAKLAWDTQPSTALDEVEGRDRWFPDGVLNTCALAVDVHVAEGRGEQTALIYDSPVTNTTCSWMFS